MTLNDVTMNLPTYPMEALAKIRQDLVDAGTRVFDFGTGDPRIPTWAPIKQAMKDSIPEISQYPSINGSPELRKSIWGYCERRFSYQESDDLDLIPTNGSKEAVFHIALSLVGRAGGRKSILYPNPGYPVYKSSILFSGGTPVPINLDADDGFKIKPWDLPESVQADAAALWINYPHNPTGSTADEGYLKEIIAWCQKRDVILLSDDCYTDIYHSSWDNSGERPHHILKYGHKNILSFMSLSKRSGLTGYRSGFILGDRKLIGSIRKARANFGVGTPLPIQAAATVAWNDDEHVAERRKIFTERLDYCFERLQKMNMIQDRPQAGFYLWCPLREDDDDITFSLDLAKHGVITSPSQWLSEGIKGYVRLAMVPDQQDLKPAMDIMETFVTKRY
ncbi:pyridoxal phosphate-dependent aminotransferase [Pseudobacteriovorax antillogorgiicola]|uniref:Succinyldiaminopimelate transaminase n=1 Tax=Pseudobacteriovorax antillogorgiicola TaxID=1513793 RepID=A0A1Y6C7I5_9BACT|nr:pyridoxal phosphate-dependent aminotransferase [Pseudobacteriovorax antillogorgiicola]TCS49463.1 succinyldiaminopimelate transaminase [Pseudobacteriovorax antillogorgiicola]SMF46318.1 succinyldiaminopimelate transaminase [Pseudobacteriovorax antillogorgiicola]